MSATSFVNDVRAGKAKSAREELKHLLESKLVARKAKAKAEFEATLKK